MDTPHKYEYEITSGSAPDRVIRMVGENKKVLEIGSGPGAITRKLFDNKCRVTALEIDPSAIEIVKQYCEGAYQCDFNDPEWPTKIPDIDQFEVLVVADVFEHLYDPWACLKKLHKYVAQNGSLVVSLSHVGHAAIIACLLDSDFDYHDWGLLDKTHIRFFGLKNMQSLFAEAGFKIVEVEFVVTDPEWTELASHWNKMPADTQRNLLDGKFSRIYQVVMRATPIAAEGEALDLMCAFR